MSVTFFKDYHKETKDLLTKFYSKPNAWKVESKLRAGKDQITVNPVATDKEITCDVEFKTSQNPLVTLKATVTKDKIARAFATFEQAPHKVDVSSDMKGNVEGAYEVRQGKFSLHAKGTKEKAEGFVSASPYPGVSVGGGAAYTFSGKATSWSAGARFADKVAICDLFTSCLRTFTLGAVVPLTVDKYKLTLGAQADVERSDSGVALKNLEGGAEVVCPVFPTNRLKLRVNNKQQGALVYVAQLPRWKAAVTLNSDKTFGAHFILE